MKLTAQAVTEIIQHCLYSPGEDTTGSVRIQGVLTAYGFHPVRLEEKRQSILGLLAELPDEFRSDIGGGWSFLNACQDRHGNLWGEHIHVEMLMCLGAAISAVSVVPKNLWYVLPGGMPYFSVTIPPQLVLDAGDEKSLAKSLSEVFKKENTRK